MPVKIELFNRYQLRTHQNDPSLLLLPAIEIKPIPSLNLPYISRINISVSGLPKDLAAQMQAAYKSVDFGTNRLLKLATPQRLRQSDCRWNQPLPPGVNCTLQVTVEYFDSDEMDQPNLSSSKRTLAECNIWTYPIKDYSLKEPLMTFTEFTDSVLNPLKSTASPPPPETELAPENQKSEITYPGWFAIDFGTSNSTVTLYDPKVIVTPHSLPSEQELKLRDRLSAWITQRPVDDVLGVSREAWVQEWQRFLAEVSKNLQDNTVNLRNLHGENFLEAIRQIEIALSKRLPWFRRAASRRLNQIYHEVFRVPALEWQSLIPVELDKTRRLSEIPSELEVISLEPTLPTDDPAKVKVSLGEQAKQHRLDTIRLGEEIGGRFLHSPKRYFGQERSFPITLNGKEDNIPVNKLLQAAYAQLMNLTEEYRQRSLKCSQGKFYRAVVTYPTIASPFVRREIEQLVKQLDIEDVQMAYDEAVSVAIFFLWREFGGDLNLGIESFKTRCRQDGDRWWQNVLVLDIGGGTTDLALIRLALEEINPFEPGEERGDGGRYYKLTPKLLGSSGHLQLGGELITLRLFLLLKAAIADCLLSAIAEDILPKDVLKVQPEELSDRFLENSKFQKGSLLACVDNEIREGEAYKEALNDAEKVLPTRWKNAPSRAQNFYSLWEYAEAAKITLGQKHNTPDASVFILDGQKISELLAQHDIYLPSSVIDSLSVTLTVEQFEKAVAPVVREAIGIAQGLIENALKNQSETVDWLILSGKTCNLELVERELYRVFSKSDYFVWNEERVTFEPEYTKLATSAGACFAEKLRQLSFAPQQAKELLRKGANQLYIDVKNLFYFLPCSFVREVIGGSPDPIFHAGQELYQLQAGDAMAKFRSRWLGMQLTNNIRRQDFENMKLQLWGSYNGDALMKKLGINEEDFKNSIQIQFEINQKLDIDLLLCRGNPHYLISRNIPYLDAAKAIGVPALISSDVRVICDIAVNVAESASVLKTDAHTVVFAAETDYSKDLQVFRDSDGGIQQSMGLIAELPPFPASGKHSFYFQFRNPESNKWELIGELPQPEVKTEYPCKYYASVNEQGLLRVHAFEVPYWTSLNPECLKQEGCVFRDSLQAQSNNVETERDPFCGLH
ncbi:molecular chaperone [Chlorogloeopsis sp. ULAP01]|uniref:molecular chaperone n=1 Tax=Chlorogloeopsis sp. ULAP01 TaxID=3056483 RepID=UPI0025AA4DD6|nr:molecular chaperone [Chlorogloeopsis sp. ULAP01]MDM9382731.1 molecular chaperone [Chlorogloeopsis sp. ULAP01]